MELEGDSLLPIADEQETVSMELNTSAGMDLLSQCQTHEVEGAVIIYDTESQEMAEEDKSSEDPDNFITLHASTDVKSEVQEEAASAENLDEVDNETDDDETIATFVTSTGQQLALYAVEDSDEIFAVALYDESGEPPTNFHFLMKADVERLIGEGAVKTVKKPQAQPNRESKPAEKKEEIKFERLSDLQAKAEKEEAAAVQLKKVQEMQNEKKREEVAAAAAAAAAATAASVQLKTVHLVQTEKKEEAVAAPVQLKKVHETKVDIKEEVASPAQLKNLHEMKSEIKEETTSAPAPVPAQLKKVHEMKTEKKDVVGASQFKKVHDLKTENKEEAAQLKKIHEVKTEIVEVPGPQPKAQTPKPQCRIVQKVEQKKAVGTPNRNLINRNINSPNVSTITKTTKTYGNIKSPNASTITKTYSNMKTPAGTPTITRVIKTYANMNTPSGSTIAKTTKTYGNAPGVSTVYKTTKPIGNINSPNASTITKTTKTIGNINSPSASTITKTTKIIGSTYQPRMTQPKKETKVAYVVSNDSQYVIDNVLEDLDSDTEIIEESTVQYILCDGDPSDSEMTFDELQASLQSFKANKPSVNQTKTSTPQKTEKKKETIIRYSTFLKSSSKVAPILSQKREPVTTVYRTYSKSPKKARMTNNLLHPMKKIKQEVEDSSYGDTSAFDDGHLSSDDLSRNTSKQNASMSDTPGMVKVKRSRKQQLTMVNRTDSEIIIQSAYSEGEEEPVVMKKRGRRRKKLSPDPDYNPRKVLKKAKKANRSVEVIEIDVDESERASGQDSTLEGNKGKCSSDKENETISVNDSEAEAEVEEEPSAPKKVKQPMMQCSHCNRNFRKRKALEKHVQVCPKSPAYIQKLEERKKLAAQSGKRFKCKSCEETFDIAVSLARHVRVVHSLRKKKTKTERSESSESEEEEEDVPGESMEESSPKPESARKRRGRPPAKKSLANESPSSNIELKLDSSTESLHQEPKKRGRPPGRKSVVKAPRKRSISKERSLSPDSEDAAVSSESLPKKRGKPTRRNLSKDDEQEAPEGEGKIDSSNETEKTLESTPLKKETKPMVVLVNFSKVGKSMNSEADETYESSDEMPLEARKKRSNKRSVSKDDKSVSSEGEKKNDSSDETPLEARKKTRSNKTSVSKDDTEAEEKNYSSDEAPLEARKKARTSKASVAKEDSSVTAEADEKNESLDEAPLEARKKAIMSKPSTSKDDRSVSPEVKDERSKAVEEKSKEARSATPDPEKKEEKTAELSEELKEVPAKKTVEETVQEIKENPITEAPKKRKLSKDESKNVDDSAPFKPEDKVETSVEVSVEPSRKKTRSAKESISTDEESEIQIAKEKSEDSEAPSGTRKKGRPSKAKLTVEEEMEALMAEDEPESSTENPTESRNRGKPSGARTSVEEELEVPVEEEKEKPAKVSEHSAEIRRKSRSSKDVTSAKEDETEISDSKESTSESSEHPRKQVRSSKDVPATKDDEPEIPDSKESTSECPEIPQKRDRSSKERLSKDDESESPDREEKTETTSETPRRRGRPSKDKSSKSESVDDSATEVETPVTEEKTESACETPRRRGRPSKNQSSKSESVDNSARGVETSVTEEKTESASETPRRRGRPTKDQASKSESVDDSATEADAPVTEEKTENASETPRRRGRPTKDQASKSESVDDSATEADTPVTEEKTENASETPRRRGRPTKDQASKSESVDDLATEVDKKVESPATDDKDKGKTKKKVQSPSRTWKVKKLNCEDCGKWFSSATLLKTHRLQHRTKKSARLDADRCPLCRKAIPGDLFAKHMATVHKKKSPTIVGATRRPDVRRVAKPARKPRNSDPFTAFRVSLNDKLRDSSKSEFL
ncbi:hypothetical protein TSAR_011682 [Trichomalopsis sarcophagae]|uniref:C2H2-type domain-containing protein n=1 Tax=Trichomalopsis sarcophagae TaxID=543379 RepID=A0A232F0K4_9HYME|nr:hypothetical protein TSAR_011682 [Trichomalopsis sarcophagae]